MRLYFTSLNQPIHSRMPVILDRDEERDWIASDGQLSDFLRILETRMPLGCVCMKFRARSIAPRWTRRICCGRWTAPRLMRAFQSGEEMQNRRKRRDGPFKKPATEVTG